MRVVHAQYTEVIIYRRCLKLRMQGEANLEILWDQSPDLSVTCVRGWLLLSGGEEDTKMAFLLGESSSGSGEHCVCPLRVRSPKLA